MNLYRIRDEALVTKRSVFSIQQLSHLISKPKTIAKVYSSRLIQKGLASSVMRGKIAFTNDEYVIACQMIEPSYISCRSALLMHGVIQQVPKFVECCCVLNSRTYASLGIRYHKISSSLFFGFQKVEKAGSYILLADVEKALIDAVYLNLITKKQIRELKDSFDMEKVQTYIGKHQGWGEKKLRSWFGC